MKTRDSLTLLLLAALWGASYLFMRLSAGAFGAVPLAALRALGATLLLLPAAFHFSAGHVLRTHWKSIALVGLTNSALPFVMFSYAATVLPAGLSSIFSATAPMFTALIGWIWLREKASPAGLAGMVIGFLGVAWLVGREAALGAWDTTTGLAMAACLLAAVGYGTGANIARRHLRDVPPLAVAAGSQLASAGLLAGPAVARWPAAVPSPSAWLALGALVVFSTALAYILFFRLIGRIGAPRTMTVTFLIPIFGLLWGTLFLGESINPSALVGATTVLLGTLLTTGKLRLGLKSFSCAVIAAKP